MAKKRAIVKPFSNDAVYNDIKVLVEDAVKTKTRDVFTKLVRGGLSRDELITRMGEISGEAFGRVSTIVDTGLSIVGRERINDVANELGLEWFRYIGGTIATSREFCTERDGGYYHKAEVESWADEDWEGKIPETNSETIFSYCGGYNCRHELIPVNESGVPADVKQFNAAERAQARTTQEFLEKDAKLSESEARETTDDEAAAVYELAHDVGVELDVVTRSIAERYDALVTPLNYKTEESIIRKASTELDGFVTGSRGVKDPVRNTIITDRQNIESLARDLQTSPYIERFKVQDFSKTSGYRGYLTNTKLSNGVWAETQLNTAEMIYAKEPEKIAKSLIGENKWNEINKRTGLPGGKGHEYYEAMRTKGVSNKVKAELEQKSREYYKNFYYSYPKNWGK